MGQTTGREYRQIKYEAETREASYQRLDSWPPELRIAFNEALEIINTGSVDKVLKRHGVKAALHAVEVFNEKVRRAHYEMLETGARESEAKGLLADLGL